MQTGAAAPKGAAGACFLVWTHVPAPGEAGSASLAPECGGRQQEAVPKDDSVLRQRAGAAGAGDGARDGMGPIAFGADTRQGGRSRSPGGWRVGGGERLEVRSVVGLDLPGPAGVRLRKKSDVRGRMGGRGGGLGWSEGLLHQEGQGPRVTSGCSGRTGTPLPQSRTWRRRKGLVHH